MPIGTLKTFNFERGYGFLKNDDGSGDTFVHISQLEYSGLPDVRVGQHFEFAIMSDPKTGRPKACDLKRIHAGVGTLGAAIEDDDAVRRLFAR